MKENARQGFWNGALPPIVYRIVAGERRGHRTKKTLEIAPFQAETCAASSAKAAGFGVPSSVSKWRTRRDSNYRASNMPEPANRSRHSEGRPASNNPRRRSSYRRPLPRLLLPVA